MNEKIPSSTLHMGDCLEIMDHLESCSIDTCITDPPYGLKFMGKNWDHGVPGVPFWRKVLRVLKPGGFLLAFGGTRTHHRLTVAIEDSGFEIRDCLMWLYGSGFPKSLDISKAIDKADEAKMWDGWGTALKPAWEPIIVAMKPREGTFVNNALKHRVAGLNIDGSRIDTLILDSERRTSKPGGGKGGIFFPNGDMPKGERHNPKGRWPSNLLLDEEAARLLDEQSGDLKPGGSVKGTEPSRTGDQGVYGTFNEASRLYHSRNDRGGASRFFYCAKASRKERGKANKHPTVKPLDLMRYLCKLTKTPTEGVVLDPFMGSGSTGIACILEGRDFIGIEIDPEYWQTAWDRIENFDPLPV
jgi:site-specific DNA-methyltransferase (adenine-specific)